MTSKPITFCTELIPRLLDDSKTMTRRVNRRFYKGDILWVEETWREYISEFGFNHIIYKANYNEIEREKLKPWKPSIFMPKRHARIFLEVLRDSWQEKLQDISGDDVISEGVTNGTYLNMCLNRANSKPFHEQRLAIAHRIFADLWNRLNGKKHPWESNPDVWLTKFRRIK